MPRKLTNEEFLAKFKEKCPDIDIDMSTYKGVHQKAILIDRELGPWEAVVHNVMNGGKRHPDRKQQRTKETFIRNYGVDSPFKDASIQAKKRKTCLEKYGTEHALQNKEIHDKTKQSLKARYGVESPWSSPEIREKCRQTMVEKYGVEGSLSSPLILERFRQTSIKNFGVSHPMLSEEIRSKSRETCLEIYGVDNPAKSPIVQSKIASTTMDRYGVTCVLKLDEIKEKARIAWAESPNFNTSSPEKELSDWIVSHGFSVTKKRLSGREIDIFIEELNIGIEYNGLYWHSEDNGKDRNYHLSKTLLCEAEGIRLIHIWDFLWLNREEQVKGYLLSILGKNDRRLFARKCSFREIPVEIGNKFLAKHHIQGPASNVILMLGAFDSKDNLVSVSSFSRHHRFSDRTVLSRFVTTSGTTVVGALSKFTKMASSMLGTDLTTWADRCLSQGKGYLSAGWTLKEKTSPDYFYHKAGKIFSKQSQMKKSVGTPEGMTEREHARIRGFSRVWDCGKLTFVYPYKPVPQSVAHSDNI